MNTANEPLYEGKTKRIFADDDQAFCVIESKADITAHDDPALTRKFATKAGSATTTTCRVFELLQEAGLPVAYDRQLSETTFRAQRCRMLPLECVARRLAAGSFVKRQPEIVAGTRFHRLTVECFLKTTNGIVRCSDGGMVQCNLPVEDPLIHDPTSSTWELRHPKLPHGNLESFSTFVRAHDILTGNGDLLQWETIERLTRQAFLVLERAWGNLGFRLVDYKIECGIDVEGTLRIADVIDNDSWRLRTSDGKEVSKQLFRDGHPLAEVEEKYALVAKLSKHFRMPHQALMLWRGSDKDDLPTVPSHRGVTVEQIVCSAHRSPAQVLSLLEELLARYPDGGVILACVGKSNGLGPMLAARTTWPVIGVPMTAKEHPHDVWSSLELPSSVPMATVLSPGNAVLAALNILALSNPALYAALQYDVEILDT